MRYFQFDSVPINDTDVVHIERVGDDINITVVEGGLKSVVPIPDERRTIGNAEAVATRSTVFVHLASGQSESWFHVISREGGTWRLVASSDEIFGSGEDPVCSSDGRHAFGAVVANRMLDVEDLQDDESIDWVSFWYWDSRLGGRHGEIRLKVDFAGDFDEVSPEDFSVDNEGVVHFIVEGCYVSFSPAVTPVFVFG